jgi:hypothetical protein
MGISRIILIYFWLPSLFKIRDHDVSFQKTHQHQCISAKLSLRNYNTQVIEALAGVKAVKKMTGLGMPIRPQAN